MEFWTREIYWNVGREVILPMYLLGGGALLVAVAGFAWRIRRYRRGRPAWRGDSPWLRLLEGGRNTLLQRKVARSGAGRAHALLFIGFALLFLGTLLVMLQEDLAVPLGWGRILSGPFYLGFSLVLDLAGLAGLLGLSVLFVRRFILGSPGLVKRPEELLLHGLLLAILVSGFLVEGARIAATELNTPLARWSPAGLAAAHLLGGGEKHAVLWWSHLGLSLLFIAVLPFTRLRHLVLAPASDLLGDRRPKGALDLMSFTALEDGPFGVARPQHLTWKDLLDADACTACARCENRCPAHATEKPLSPMRVMQQIRTAKEGSDALPLPAVVGEDAVWSCTTCRACEEACPVGVEPVAKLIGLRRQMVQMEGRFPAELIGAFENIEQRSNPWGIAPAEREKWGRQLELQPFSPDRHDVLLYVGCAGSFDPRGKQVTVNLALLLNAAGVTWGVLGRDEPCCGDSARRLGNEYLFAQLATANVALLRERGVKRIVTLCPHCLTSLKNDYTQFGGDFEVMHHSELLAQLLADGRLSPDPRTRRVTLHDSCYLARYNGVVVPPRELLQMSGATLVEVERHGVDGFCCGAGGGRMWAEEQLGRRINRERTSQLLACDAEEMVTACPYCMTMLQDALKDAGERSVPVRDVCEVLAEAVLGERSR